MREGTEVQVRRYQHAQRYEYLVPGTAPAQLSFQPQHLTSLRFEAGVEQRRLCLHIDTVPPYLRTSVRAIPREKLRYRNLLLADPVLLMYQI